MPLVHDPGLAAHADQVRDTYDTARTVLSETSSDRGLESAVQITLPDDVAAAQAAFLAELRAAGVEQTLELVQYFRYVNDQLVEGWTGDQEPGPDPVQLSQTITVAGRAGAYIEVRQWIARTIAPAATTGPASSAIGTPAPPRTPPAAGPAPTATTDPVAPAGEAPPPAPMPTGGASGPTGATT